MLELAMADDETSITDDAVSNRSDDTALDEATSAHGNGAEAAAAQSTQPAPISEMPVEDEMIAAEAAEAAATEEIARGEGAAEEEPNQDENTVIEEEAEPVRAPRPPVELIEDTEEEIRMDWYILKVQSNRERSIAEALERKMKIAGLDRYFDQVIVPTEKVTEFKAGKKKVVERKLYPGYIVVHMHINDDTWFAVRETSGVGDFTGSAGKPTPMLQSEVNRIIQTEEEETSEAPKLDIKFASGDKVKVKEGNFESFEGEVNTIDEASGRVTVMINIFGRSTPVELEYWQIEAV
jgi:transcriptional antiterminator NusG